uniref:ATP synthase complex subunit 8 n=1 Tax=Niphades castanea TaxID=2027381 RepID=A0A6M4AD60_9CUCU|nr:ATP synthase F0 subunit 8 [Niphades castanea]
MPQMAPLSWLSLYFYFIILFMFILILNYYMFLYTPNFKKNKTSYSSINWKW